MKSTVGRVYVAAIAVLVFFLLWATVSAHPWANAAKLDPRVADLQARERNVRVEVSRAQAAVTRRWAVYNSNLTRRKVAIARADKLRAAAVARARAIAVSRRRVVYRSVGGSGGGRSYSGGSSGGGGGGGGSSRGGAGGSAAPPAVVSLGGGAPVSSSGTS